MEKKNFDEVLSNLMDTIHTPAYYSDFKKAIVNVEEIEDGLNLLDGLIGKENPEKKLSSLIDIYGDKITSIIPILHAIRLFKTSSVNNLKYLNSSTKELEAIYFSGNKVDKEQLINFCIESGLLDIFKNRSITSTKSYVTGVEVGLDTNARKNRTGFLMEALVESILKSDTKIEEVYSQINIKSINEKFGKDLSDVKIGEKSSKANKIFDFAFEFNNQLYVVETNFYSGGGSKLNETARSYKQLEVEINKIEGCHFIWITDGIGWRSARGNLQETYEHNNYVFTLEMLKNKSVTDLILGLYE